MRKRYVPVLVALAFAGAAPVAQSSAEQHSPNAVVAKSCHRGYKHAVIGGSEKCLRRGQFCKRAYARDYERYGFACNRRNASGRYYLT
jgi:hypothetical protein